MRGGDFINHELDKGALTQIERKTYFILFSAGGV